MFKRARDLQPWRVGQWFLWVALVLFLPVTSLPLLIRWVGSDTVAAPSGLFLLALMVGWLIPYLMQSGRLSKAVVPLVLLAFVAVLSTVLSMFLPIPPYKGISPWTNQLQALITLGVGLSFFLVSSAWPRTERRLEWTLRLLNWSGAAVLIWSLAQALAWYTGNRYPEWMRTVHGWYSIGPLFRQRVTGFSLEPSWLAHQLNMLYLPLWLAATMQRYSAHRKLWRQFTIENLHLIGGAVVLFLTLSRIGLLAFLLVMGFVLLRLNARLLNWLQVRVIQSTGAVLNPMILRLVMVVILLGFYVGLILGMGYGLSRFDPRMKGLFNLSVGDEAPLLRYASQLTFASRVVYWQAGWRIFSEHPWLGVGLGNAGFFFPKQLSGYAWGLVEVRDLLFRSTSLLNIKSLWVRLLAETGIVGFASFAAWLFLIWRTGRYLERIGKSFRKCLGLAGQLMLVAFLLEGFSLDTFALPYCWFLPGLVTAAVSLEDKVNYE